MAMQNTTTPTGLILSRQEISSIPTQGDAYAAASQAKKGGYLVKKISQPDITLVANGSEVATLLDAATILEKETALKINVASVISEGLFRNQSIEYQESIIPSNQLTFGLTAGLPVNLQALVGTRGKVFGLEHFGYSAPAQVLDEKFGFTSQNIANEIKNYLSEQYYSTQK